MSYSILQVKKKISELQKNVEKKLEEIKLARTKIRHLKIAVARFEKFDSQITDAMKLKSISETAPPAEQQEQEPAAVAEQQEQEPAEERQENGEIPAEYVRFDYN